MTDSPKYEQVSTEARDSLLSEDAAQHPGQLSLQELHQLQRNKFRQLLVPLLWLTGALLYVLGSYLFATARAQQMPPQLVYTPAQEALGFQREIFPDAFHDKTHFMGDPSPQLDDYWQQTYDLPTRITRVQAQKLEHPTLEIEKGQYIVLLDIFHSMHCLNEIRKSLHPEYYPPYHIRMNTTEEKAQMHIDHCVEHVRLALWCGADLSPISFRMKDGHATGQSGYTHTCRDARAILNWARDNAYKGELP